MITFVSKVASCIYTIFNSELIYKIIYFFFIQFIFSIIHNIYIWRIIIFFHFFGRTA